MNRPTETNKPTGAPSATSNMLMQQSALEPPGGAGADLQLKGNAFTLSSTQTVQVPDSNFLMVNQHHLENAIMKARDMIQTKWRPAVPFSIGLTTLTTLITADFKDALAVEAAVWRALFLLTSILCVSWAILSGVKAVRLGRTDVVSSVMSMLRAGSSEASNASSQDFFTN